MREKFFINLAHAMPCNTDSYPNESSNFRLGINVSRKPSTDYETYKEIIGELLQPISASGLDDDTLKRLYESKLVYLENLREKCFFEINSKAESFFSTADYVLILDSIQQTRGHLKNIIIMAITNNLAKRKVS